MSYRWLMNIKNDCQNNESAFSVLVSNKTALLCGFKVVLHQFYSDKWKDKRQDYIFAEVTHT